MGRIAVLDSRSMEESGKKKKKKEEWRRRGGSVRRGVGSRRDRRAGPPSAASALGVSGGGCARSTKHAEKKRGWARVQRGVVARALPVADRRGHAPGGDRKPAALERSPLSAGEVCLLCSHRRARASAHEPAWQARLLRRAMSATPGSRASRAATVAAAAAGHARRTAAARAQHLFVQAPRRPAAATGTNETPKINQEETKDI